MSRFADFIALAAVARSVIGKSAAIGRADAASKWKTSSILRQVGRERGSHIEIRHQQSAPEADASVKLEETKRSNDAPKLDTASETPILQKSAAAAVLNAKKDYVPDATPPPPPSRPSLFDQDHFNSNPVTSNTAKRIPHDPETVPGVTNVTEQDTDLFILRNARRRTIIHRHVRPAYTSPPEDLVTAGSAALNLRSEKKIWKPQAAIDTKLLTDLTENKQAYEPTKRISTQTSERREVVEDQPATLPTTIDSPPAGPPSYDKTFGATDSVNEEEVSSLAADIEADIAQPKNHLSSSAVPSSRLSRLYHYTALGTSLGFGALAESTRRVFSPSSSTSSSFLSPNNMDRLVKKLSRMRGAALKLGQMISFQDDNSFPGPIREVLQRVQDSADYMPLWQLNRVMATEFGTDWRDTKFREFDDVPMAAASIGQVHAATTLDGLKVAVKVQYPGVANSISSDLKNLSLLLTASRLLPKGLYLDKTIENARTELGWECDYRREAENTKRFRELIGEDPVFVVPRVIDECSGLQVLTTERMMGVGIAKNNNHSQETRNFFGTELMRLCLRELAEFRFMQTDPNWTNFLWNAKTKKIELLDFGACREFSPGFINKYCQLLVAASHGNKPELQRLSEELGYLTGAESATMIDAHVSSVLTLAEPFSEANTFDAYDFENQTITDRVKSFIPVMLRERLTPPPEETYSLHRRLSGHFLLCARMKSKIRCKEIFKDVMSKNRYIQ